MKEVLIQGVLEKVIKMYGEWIFDNHICECEDKDGYNCGEKIRYPITESSLKNYRLNGIPKYVNGHQNKGKNSSKPMLGKHHTRETKEKQSKAHIANGKFHTEEWKENHSKAISGEKHPNWKGGYSEDIKHSKNRNLGFLPLNEKNEIANTMHHLDFEFVIFIPSYIHESFWHSVRKDMYLEEMNNLAWKWFDEEGYKFLLK